MKQAQLNSFLTNMFNDRMEFANINGASKLTDANYMLIADAMSENIELLGEVIQEHFEENINNFKLLKIKENIAKHIYKR